MAVAYLRQGDDSGSTDTALLESMKSDVLCARYGPLLSVALNLVLAAATGKLCRFWSGRRGSARLFATISSPAIRLALSFQGFVFLLASLYLGRRTLVGQGLW